MMSDIIPNVSAPHGGHDEEDAGLLGGGILVDAITRDQLDQAVRDYDYNTQRIDVAPTKKQLLGPFTVICLVLNRTIGSGIFTVPPKVLAGTGSVGGALMIWSCSGIIIICGALCWLEIGLTIPLHGMTVAGKYRKVSTPRSGGEKNFLEYIFKRPKMFMTCMYGIMFLILGNLSGNAVAFGIYTSIAIGKDPIYDRAGNYNKLWVVGLAVATLTFCAALHIFSRRGGIFLNNVFAMIKVCIILALAILGFVHAAGKLPATGINEPTIPKLTAGGSNITDSEINTAADDNFSDAFATNRRDLASFVDSFLYAVFSYTGFEQPFYVLSEVRQPQKVFPRAVLLAVISAILLYVLLNVSYFCVVPKEVYTTSPANSLNMAGAFLHYLFDNNYGPNIAERVMAGLIALSVLGNVLVMTFTAARVKQEIAKEGILPYSLFFATGHTTPLAWIKKRLARKDKRASLATTVTLVNSPNPDEQQGLPNIDFYKDTMNLDHHPERSPMAALALHWGTSVFLVLVTMYLKPATQYSFLTAIYSYVNFNVVGFVVSGGLLYLKADSFYRREKGRNWTSKAMFVPWLSPLPAMVYFLATSFLLFASFVQPATGSAYSAGVQGYAWFIVPTIGLSSLFWGVFWWYGLKAAQWKRRRELVVTRKPYIEIDDDGGYIQKAELVEHDWVVRVVSDIENERISPW